ncbi:hypothetical protein Tco_0873608 [Tanacetum coccineum]|uniref:Uncharacterized protein n=1 Tax=Tanacetum coccineum TaxID=301880 RepID=A0ABQ5BM62_9ASTR
MYVFVDGCVQLQWLMQISMLMRFQLRCFPPTRSDGAKSWLVTMGPSGKSTLFLDVERTQGNLIFKIAVDILKNTNFFKAFTASSTIPSIYIQQFWDIIRFDKDKGYSCQLDEQRFYLSKAILRDALQLPRNNNFTSPPPPPQNATLYFLCQRTGLPKCRQNLIRSRDK